MTLVNARPSEDTTRRPGGREAAEAAGRRLAAQIPAPPGAAAGNPVEAMARAALPRLRELGVVAEIVRARRDCIVVRSVAADPLAVAEACAFVGGWLEALPGAACGLSGTVAESTCATRGHRMCMHTLMWRAPADAPGSAAAQPPTTLGPHGEAPRGTGPSPIEAPRPAGGLSPVGPALPEPLPDAATPLPIPAVSGLAPATSLQAHAPAPQGPSSLRELAPLPLAGSGAVRHAPQVPSVPPPPSVPRVPRAPSRPAASPAEVPPEARAQRGRTQFVTRTARFGRAPWLRRRAWLLVLGLLAGSLGGFAAASHAGSSYVATAVLEVQSSATTNAVSSADGAEELAVTYAALIPADGALLAQVGADVGAAASTVGHGLSVEAVSGTALIDVRFSAGTPAASIEGADDVAGALTAAVPPGHAITPGSVSLVSAAQTAARQGSLHKYGLPIGILLGLLVGAAAALVAERTDRRVDDVDGLSAAAGCSATAEPGGISPAELAAALLATGEQQVVFVPLGVQEEPASAALGMRVAQAWRGRPARSGGGNDIPGAQSGTEGTPVVTVGVPFSSSPQALSAHRGSTVLVVAAGQRASTVQEAAERLRLLSHGPEWAVLVPRAGQVAPGDHGA